MIPTCVVYHCAHTLEEHGCTDLQDLPIVPLVNGKLLCALKQTSHQFGLQNSGSRDPSLNSTGR